MRIDLIMTQQLLERIEREQAINKETSEPQGTAERVMLKVVTAMRDNRKRIGLNSDFDNNFPLKVM